MITLFGVSQRDVFPLEIRSFGELYGIQLGLVTDNPYSQIEASAMAAVLARGYFEKLQCHQ